MDTLKTYPHTEEAEAASIRGTSPQEFDPWPRVFNLWNPRQDTDKLKNLPPRGSDTRTR